MTGVWMVVLCSRTGVIHFVSFLLNLFDKGEIIIIGVFSRSGKIGVYKCKREYVFCFLVIDKNEMTHFFCSIAGTQYS